MSQDATARCSDCDENSMSDIPSSGGAARVKSDEMSPLLLVAVEEGWEPKSAIAGQLRRHWERDKRARRLRRWL